MVEAASCCELLGTFANLVMSCAGAGILSFPYAMAQGGVLLGVLATFFVGLLNLATLRLLLSQAEVHHNSLLFRHACYEGVVELCAGPVAATLASIVIILNQFGSLVGYQIILLDLLCPAMGRFKHAGWRDDSLIRVLVTSVVAVCILFPLSLFRRIHQLAFVSSVAALAVFGTAAVISWKASSVGANGDISAMLIGTPLGAARALPLFVFAMNMHIQAVPIQVGLSVSSTRRWMRAMIVPVAMLSCMATFLAPGILAALQLADQTPGDILEAYSNADLFMICTKFTMAIHLALGYPVVLFPMLRSWEFCARDNTPIGSGSRLAHICLPPFAMRVALIICSTSLVAIFLPKVSIAFGISGSIFGSCIIYIFPAVCILFTDWKHRQDVFLEAQPPKSFAIGLSYVALVFGAIVAIFGTAATIL